jgi:ATP-dependent DNA ligase
MRRDCRDAAGLPDFAQTQAATDGERGVHVVYYAFDILHLDGWDVSSLALIERKAILEPLVLNKPGLQFNGHDTGEGELILKHAGKLGFEGVVSKTIDARPTLRETTASGAKPRRSTAKSSSSWAGRTRKDRGRILGALLLGYYADDRKLIYACRVGTGMPDKVLADLRRRLDPLARKTPPLNILPCKTRFGSPLVLSRVHWVEPKLVAEITYLTWTADSLLRHTVYVGLREDKPADRVRRKL